LSFLAASFSHSTYTYVQHKNGMKYNSVLPLHCLTSLHCSISNFFTYVCMIRQVQLSTASRTAKPCLACNPKSGFSGVVSMAANTEIKKRPQIEISFKGLTLTLRAKNKTSIKVCNRKNQAWPYYSCKGSISSWGDNVSFCSCRESNWMQDDWFDSYQWEKRVHLLI
jgi:hypothetical protein